MVLEKQCEETHHTNSSMSGGIFISPPDAKNVLEYMNALCRAGEGQTWTDRATAKAWAEYLATNKAWVESIGGKLNSKSGEGEHRQLPGADNLPTCRFLGMGDGLARFFREKVQAAKNIEVSYDTRVTHLLANSRGRIVGVEVENRRDGKVLRERIMASKGVVLCSGGYEFDERSKLNYLKLYPAYFTGSCANTGDGLRMAAEVGAELWHMNCVSGRLVGKFPGFPNAFGLDMSAKGLASRRPSAGAEELPSECGYIIVDRYGRRFTSENIKSHTLFYELTLYDSHRLLYPRVPSYWIFDSRRMEAGPLPQLWTGPAGPVRLYTWSKDNAAELAKGWIISGRTPGELARKLDMSPDVLKRTIKNFNKYCEKGADPDFGRDPRELIAIATPPYYAVKLSPGGHNTQGGPRRNGKAQIMRVDGEPIPGLYGAGELGSVYGMLYPAAGGNLAECMAFGRIAGEQSTANRP